MLRDGLAGTSSVEFNSEREKKPGRSARPAGKVSKV